MSHDRDFFEDLLTATKQTWPNPKMLIISFPHNPTTMVVDMDFFKNIVAFAKEHHLMVIHDFAYADLVFDGYKAPSFMQVPGAKDVGVELFSLSKSYSMAGWRVGFAVGNPDLIHALTRIKSYLDYGVFQPIQIASIIALNGPQECVQEIVGDLQRKKRYPDSGAEPDRMEDGKAQRDYVCLVQDPGAVQENGVGGIFQVSYPGGEGGRIAWTGLWRIRG